MERRPEHALCANTNDFVKAHQSCSARHRNSGAEKRWKDLRDPAEKLGRRAGMPRRCTTMVFAVAEERFDPIQRDWFTGFTKCLWGKASRVSRLHRALLGVDETGSH